MFLKVRSIRNNVACDSAGRWSWLSWTALT